MTRERVRTLPSSPAEHGFTLVEALIGLALMGLVLGMLAVVTAQWLPSWNVGVKRLQRADLVGLALERTAADLASAELVSLDPTSRRAFFDGTSTFVVFVRSALGPNTSGGLEIVRIAEEPDGDGMALVRSRAPFTLIGPAGDDQSRFAFSDRIVLLRSPFLVTFAFADTSRKWRDTWSKAAELPSAVKITVGTGDQGPRVSTVASLRINAPSDCARANSAWGCVEEFARGGDVRVDAEAEGPKP